MKFTILLRKLNQGYWVICRMFECSLCHFSGFLNIRTLIFGTFQIRKQFVNSNSKDTDPFVFELSYFIFMFLIIIATKSVFFFILILCFSTPLKLTSSSSTTAFHSSSVLMIPWVPTPYSARSIVDHHNQITTSATNQTFRTIKFE